MTDVFALITSLGKEGKHPQEIARALHAQGVKDRRGKIISPAMVEGLLRFAELPAEEIRLDGARWATERAKAIGSELPAPVKKRGRKAGVVFKSSWKLSEEERTEIERLYFREHLGAGDIAARLRLPYRRVTIYCCHLAGFTMPPGDIEEYFDEQGRKVLKCPPAFARGIYPQRNVGAKGGW
jgi:hypothetical protein